MWTFIFECLNSVITGGGKETMTITTAKNTGSERSAEIQSRDFKDIIKTELFLNPMS